MATSFAAAATVPAYRAPIEDVLAHLPISTTVEYRKGQIIYGQEHPSTGLYLMAGGKVKLSQIAGDGTEILLDVILTDEIFGESSLVTGRHGAEQASALENTKVMVWPISAIEDLVTKRPRLAVALLQIFAQRSVDFALRLESFSIDNIERRLARALLRFADRLGTQESEDSVRMMAFTHDLLSRHIGTSRELVTHYMNQFRRQGLLNYSRQGIVLYRDRIQEWMAQPQRHEARRENGLADA